MNFTNNRHTITMTVIIENTLTITVISYINDGQNAPLFR